MRIRFAVMSALLGLAAAGAARADTINMTNINSISDFSQVTLTDTGFSQSGVLAGEIKWVVDSTVNTESGANPGDPLVIGSAVVGAGSQVVTFCIEIGQDVTIGGAGPDGKGYSWTVDTLTNAPIDGSGSGVNPPDLIISQSRANSIYGMYEQESLTHPGIFSPGSAGSTEAAAFQLAIWEIVYGTATPVLTTDMSGDEHLTDGTFSATDDNAVIQRASVILGDASDNYTGVNTGVVALTSTTAQDQVLAFLPPGGNTGQPTPLPPVAGMGAVMLAGLAFGRWRFGRSTSRGA